MAGSSSWLSNLPLTNMPRAKDKSKKTGHEGVPQRRAASNAGVEVDDQDDEWYDCTSSEDGHSPLKRVKSADKIHSHITVKSMTPEEEAELLPYMPALFGTDLPPCGLEIQVAYENVNARLRQRWLSHRGGLGPVDICQAVKDELANQNFLFPAFSVQGTAKKRKPWRRENVFKYELRWIDYFVREAQAQAPELMTESEIMERKKEASAPAVLGLNINRQDVSRLWDEWNEKKRAKTPAMPGVDSDIGPVLGSPNGNVEQQANDNVKESVQGSTDSDVTIVQPVSGDAEDEAHLWSQGGHD